MTKGDILEKNGFDFDAFKLDNEYSAKNLLNSMNEFTEQVLCEVLKEYKMNNYGVLMGTLGTFKPIDEVILDKIKQLKNDKETNK
jgi:hypothetical protein